MFPFSFIDPLPALISLSTLTGIILHDTGADKLAKVAIGLPAIVATYEGVHDVLKRTDPHTHIERMSIDSSIRVQPRGQDDKKYVTQKRVLTNISGSEYSWPSI